MPRGRETRKVKKGGAYIAAGTYGCVFGDPPLPCKGEATRHPNDEVSKLIDTSEMKKEVKSAEAYKAIDPMNQYFLTPLSQCELDKTAVTPRNLTYRCGKYASRKSLIFYKKGGDALQSIPLTPAHYIPFLKSLLNLFKGLEVAHSRNVYHMDIKPPNLVSLKQDDGSFITRFIDFGLSVHPGRTMGTVFKAHYKYFPVDLFYYDRDPREYERVGGVHTVSHIAEAKTLLKTRYGNLKHLNESIPSILFYNYKYNPEKENQLLDYIYQVRHKHSTKYRQHLMAGTDIYALGLALAEIVFRLFGQSPKGGRFTEGVLKDYWKNNTYIDELDASPYQTWALALMDDVTMPLYQLVADMTSMTASVRLQLPSFTARYEALFPAIERLCSEEKITRFASKTIEKFDAHFSGKRIPTVRLPPLSAL